jgi:hypothetical protein
MAFQLPPSSAGLMSTRRSSLSIPGTRISSPPSGMSSPVVACSRTRLPRLPLSRHHLHLFRIHVVLARLIRSHPGHSSHPFLPLLPITILSLLLLLLLLSLPPPFLPTLLLSPLHLPNLIPPLLLPFPLSSILPVVTSCYLPHLLTSFALARRPDRDWLDNNVKPMLSRRCITCPTRHIKRCLVILQRSALVINGDRRPV